MESNLENIRHSFSHLLAAAVLELYPQAKPTLGPATDSGFYYDFDFGGIKISDADLGEIEEKMRQILKDWQSGGAWFESQATNKQTASAKFKENEYKQELIDEISGREEEITLYTTGKFTDLCRGGHAKNPKDLNPRAFKLTRVAGAYWRGDEKNQMLTRIYGAAFETKEDLESHLAMLEEAKKRDHKKLGAELDLFVFSPLVGGGLPLWTPKGTTLRNILDSYVWELRREKGYELVDIPHITKKELYETSGHWEKFEDQLFKIKTREGHLFAMKPMNCPHHTQIYARKKWSYRELPQRYASTTKVYRDEQTGELSGLSRVRSITQDDAHVFCRQSQVKEEADRIWDVISTFYKAAGFEKLSVRLSLHDPKQMKNYLGSEIAWQDAEGQLRQLIEARKADYAEAVGEAAFYGPKIDFVAKDSMGRAWQVATIQLDMNMPQRFDLFCVNEKGEEERIVMVHAAVMGSIERFLSILIEHHAGKLPLWMSPIQARALSVGEKFSAYAQKVLSELKKAGVRAELDTSSETLGKKIRDGKNSKIPYLVVVGENEEKNSTVSAEHFKKGKLEQMSLADFAQLVAKESEKKEV